MENLRRSILLALLVLGIFGCETDREKVEDRDRPTLPSLTVQASGLAGDLTVVLNGREEMILNHNGSFNFPTHLPAGSPYQVELRKKPDDLLCEITNGRGKIVSGKVIEVQVVCRQADRWHHPVSPADTVGSAGQSNVAPVVAISDNGYALAVLTRFDGSSWQLLAREYREGKWQNEQMFSKGPGKIQNPRAAMAGNGDAVIVWEQADKDGNFIMLAERRDGLWKLPPSAADHISIGAKYAWEPDVAVNEKGDAIVAWSQDSESGVYGIYTSEFRNGQWHHPKDFNEQISPAGGSDALRPRVAINNAGTALIAWEQDVDGNSRIFTSEFRNGVWHHPASPNDSISPKSEGNRGAYMPMVAMDEKENALIAWKQAHENKERIYLSEYRGGTWHHPQSLAEAVSPQEIISANINDLDMDSRGNAMLLWTAFSDRKQSLYKAEYREGKWIHPAGNDPFVASPQEWEFTVLGNCAMTAGGKAVIAWLQRGDARTTQAYLAEYDKGQWTLPGKLLNIGDQPASGLAVASSSQGNLIIAWAQNDGKEVQIYASIYLVETGH